MFRHNAEYCYSDRLGEGGVSKERVALLLEGLTAPLHALQERTHPAQPLLELSLRRHDIAAISIAAAEIRERFKRVVVIGSGGSGLGGRVLTALAPQASPALEFIENIDPDMTAQLLTLDIPSTCFIVISKSGATVETLAQFYVLFAHAKALLQDRAAHHFIIITSPGDNPLRDAGREYAIRMFDYATDIGGRFSALTVVGLLPAAIAGLDIEALRRGALAVVSEMDKAAAPAACHAALGAALQYAFIEKGRNVSVMLPYCERLSAFAQWYRQSWAESLGKNGKGSTPVPAMGSTDQHSQLQLYLGGPRDKLFHVITLKRAGTGPRIPTPERDDMAYLKGKTIGDVMEAQQKSVLHTLVKNGCPVRHFELMKLGEEQLGELLMHFTLEIIFMGHLLGVDAFDQPAVEDSKQLARDYLRDGAL